MAEQILQTRGSVTTCLGALNQLSRLLGMKDKSITAMTLNTKYKVLANVDHSTTHVTAINKMPVIQYFGAGCNGYVNIDSTTGSTRYNPYTNHLDLYKPIPVFAIATADEASKKDIIETTYRMRSVATINNVKYAFYYLKKVTADPDTIQIKQLSNGTETDYIFKDTDLKPTPIVPSEGGSVSSDNRIIVRGTLSVELTSDEIKNVVSILAGHELNGFTYTTNDGRISEYGFYSGYEVYTDSNHAAIYAADQDYKEAAYTQLAKHICTRGVDLSDDGMSINPKVCFEYSDILPVTTTTA